MNKELRDIVQQERDTHKELVRKEAVKKKFVLWVKKRKREKREFHKLKKSERDSRKKERERRKKKKKKNPKQQKAPPCLQRKYR